VTQVLAEDWNRIDVHCPGTGLALRKRFLRGNVCVNGQLDPYALVATIWFEDHPEPAKVWKVGDLVPEGTVVGKRWAGEPRQMDTFPVLYQGDEMNHQDRVIIWIES
jgi:hypothetical protein